MALMNIRCKIYFVFFIFVVCANHENIFTTKISRSTVVCFRTIFVVIHSCSVTFLGTDLDQIDSSSDSSQKILEGCSVNVKQSENKDDSS